MIARLRRWISRFFLHGTLLGIWLRRLSARLGRAYSRLLIDRVRQPLAGTVRSVPRPAPKEILFLCDNMWERRELLPELEKICTVTFLDAGKWKLPARRVADERLAIAQVLAVIGELRNRAFDVIFVYLNSALLSDELLALLRATWSCPIVGLNLDDKTTYASYGIMRSSADNYRRWAARFDCNLTNSCAMVDVYRAEGFPSLYLPTGFHYDPAKILGEPPPAFEHALTFVGSRKPERAQFIAELAARGIATKVFGNGWPGARFTNEGWQIYRASQLNLGIGYNLTGTQFTNLKNRDFECPGSGGCYLTTYDWELANLYEIGREILCYRNLDELVELYCHYIRDPEACRKIARAGFLRATREHTWERRFRRVLAELGFQA